MTQNNYITYKEKTSKRKTNQYNPIITEQATTQKSYI